MRLVRDADVFVTNAPIESRARLGIRYEELAAEADNLSSGDRVLCMGVGSGLNTAMTEIVW